MNKYKLLLSLFVISSAQAEVTYEYVGNNYVDNGDDGQILDDPAIPGSYDTSMRVSGTFTVAEPFEQMEYSDISGLITSYSFSDGRTTLTEENSSIVLTYIAVDVDGQIIQWSIFVETIRPTEIGAQYKSVVTRKFGSGLFSIIFDEGFVEQCYQPHDSNPSVCDTYVDNGRIVGFPGSWSLLPGNLPPTADAGPDQAIRAGQSVSLDGTSSFDDNTASADLLYSWSIVDRPSGSTEELTGADTATPSFIADAPGTYIVDLVVTDTEGLMSTPASVMISSANLAPTANAGPAQLVVIGSDVVLDGSQSTDPEDDPLFFAWTITSAPAGSTALLVDADTASPSFVPDVTGIYELRLDVADQIGFGTGDLLEITATTSQEFSQHQIVESSVIVASLGVESVTSEGNQRALMNTLAQAVGAIDQGKFDNAIGKLESALDRTDGCTLGGQVDGDGPGRDWITVCDVQIPVYSSLDAAKSALLQ